MSRNVSNLVLCVYLFLCLILDNTAADGPTPLHLPNTSGIDGQLTANLGVDHFFSLWLVFNNDEVQISDQPYTILAPNNSADTRDETVLLKQPELVKKLLLDHVVLGSKLDLTNLTTEISFKTLGGRTVIVKPIKEGSLQANEATILQPAVEVPNGVLIILDNYLFPDEQQKELQKKNLSSNALPQEPTPTKAPPLIDSTQTETPSPTEKPPLTPPPSLSQTSDTSKLDVGLLTVVTAKEDSPPVAKPVSKTSFVENVQQVLSFLKSGVRVFQHFLLRSNVSKLIQEGEEYTVFVPTDHAFQRWHPIDWGFYPFSVPEFTETIIINHFIKGRIKQDNIQNDQKVKTIGGREVVFRKTPNQITVNGAAIVKGDTPVSNGNIMFIGEVLFVSESVVSKLHQQHRDKETPPLLAFPWFGAQFLSHAFLALERDRRFTHITRFLNLADLAPHVSGTGYTFFVPVDSAFEEIGLDKMPDNYLSTGDGLQILLNHFVKGRLYDRELKDGLKLQSLGNKTIHVMRNTENVRINKATIVESEVFVYNLGTMFYVDKVLFVDKNTLPLNSKPEVKEPKDSEAQNGPNLNSTAESDKDSETEVMITQISTSMKKEVEMVPEELAEGIGTSPDVLLTGEAEHMEETTTNQVDDEEVESRTVHKENAQKEGNVEESSTTTQSNKETFTTTKNQQ